MLSTAWAIIGIAFAAFCVWLTVRIVNRRERWAKWMAVGVFVVVLAYFASFGPFVWLGQRNHLPHRAVTAGIYFYWPQVYAGTSGAPTLLKAALNWYTELWLIP
jgi:hypothetical protein